MAFDISTAKPVEQKPKFDIASAKPVQQETNFVNEDVPTTESLNQQIPQKPEPTFGETLIGVGDAALSLGTAATTGALGMLGGTVEGVARDLAGDISQEEAKQIAMRGAEQFTFTPRTEVGQNIVKYISDKLQFLSPAGAGAAPIGSFRPSQLKTKIPGSKARHIRGVLSDEIKAGNINAGNIAKTLDADGSLIKNPNTKRAIKLLGDNDDAYSAAINFEKMNNATRSQFNKMLDSIVSNKKSGDPLVVMKNRPVNVIGEGIANRAIKLNSIKNDASRNIGKIVNGPAGEQPVNISKARDNFINALSESDVDVLTTEKGLTADTGRTLTNIKEVISDERLNNTLRRLESGTLSVKDAHKLKRNLRELVSYDPAAPGAVKVSQEIESAVKNLTSEINAAIGAKNKGYATQNKIISESIDALKEADKALGNTLMIGDDLAVSKFGALSKRIGTNLASKEKVTSMINSLNESLGKRGIRPKDDIERLVSTVDTLEKIFELESKQAPFGFQSRVGKGVLEASTTGTPTTAALSAVKDAVTDIGKLSFEDKVKALRILSAPKENK
jgi:hypothetical protein